MGCMLDRQYEDSFADFNAQEGRLFCSAAMIKSLSGDFGVTGFCATDRGL